MDQNLLVVLDRQLQVLDETIDSFRVFLLRPISPMPSTFGLSRNSGIIAITSRDRLDVLRLLGVDAQPAVMLDAVLGRPLRLDLGELAEVVAKAIDRAAVEARPKRRLADADAAHLGQGFVVVGGPRDHVDVGVEVVHGARLQLESFDRLGNPKSEARNPKQARTLKIKCGNASVVNFSIIQILNLFRISCFVFRASYVGASYRGVTLNFRCQSSS